MQLAYKLPMKTENTLRLLFIEDSSDTAETITNILRKAGHGVRELRVNGAETLQAALNEQFWDAILCATRLREFDVLRALALLNESGKDVPFIVLYDGEHEPLAWQALSAGARAMVPSEQAEHLPFVMARELNDLEQRRTQRRCAKALRESERRCRLLIDRSRDAIAYAHEGMYIYVNAVYLKLFGYGNPQEIEGVPILDMVASADHAKFKAFLRNYDKEEQQTDALEVQGVRTDGSPFLTRMEFSPASVEGEACTQIIIRNLAENNNELEKNVISLKKQDALTGLYNRPYFLEQLEAAVSKAIQGLGHSALLYIELDNWQAVKENLGVVASDTVLIDFARVLRDKVNELGPLAHFGDDIFTLLLHNNGTDDAVRTAETLRKAVEEHTYNTAGQSVVITCTVGIGLITEKILSGQDIMSRVIKTCAVGKSAGGNKVHLHHSVTAEHSNGSRDTERVKNIQAALRGDRFRLTYQPIVSLHSVAGENYQVLVRMLDERGNFITPAQFMPDNNCPEVSMAIDRWVIAHAISKLATRNRHGHNTAFFVKLFADTLKDQTLLTWIGDLLKAARLAGDRLTLEISEEAAVSRLNDVKAFSEGLKGLRCRFALNHFGRVSKSFDYIKHLAGGVDYLKLDHSLLVKLKTDEQDQATVQLINKTAHAMGMATVAEFVQYASTVALLWQYGTDYVQGDYLQKPSEALNYDFSQ